MKKIIIAVIILIVVAIATKYLVFNNSTETYPATSNNEQQTTETAPISNVAPIQNENTVIVDIKNFLFNPSTITIKSGTKVTWTNNDSMPHTITSDSDNILNSPTLSPGQSFDFTFTNTGDINYHCSIHPTMKVIIVVQK